jgi:hypothetical protein
MADNLRRVQLEICRSIAGRRDTDVALSSLDDPTWHELLRFLDENGLTLLFRRRFAHAALPGWISQRLEKNFRDNQKRYETILTQQAEILRAFTEKNIETTLLKGTALARQTHPDPSDRVQYDFDFLVRPDQLRRAEAILANQGYRRDSRQTPDHVCMVPPEKYRWTGNFFDPRIPLKVELHDCLWHNHYRIDLDGLLSSPETVPAKNIGLQPARILSPVDQFLFLNLHFFRHLFQNQVRLSHLFEIAILLEQFEVWPSVLERTKESRAGQQILILNWRLLAQLFGMPEKKLSSPIDDVDLPTTVQIWLERDAVDDLLSRFSRNKNYVRLQMEFSQTPWLVLRDALRVHRPPPPARVRYEMQGSGTRRLPIQYAVYCLQKIWEHLRGYFRLMFKTR